MIKRDCYGCEGGVKGPGGYLCVGCCRAQGRFVIKARPFDDLPNGDISEGYAVAQKRIAQNATRRIVRTYKRRKGGK